MGTDKNLIDYAIRHDDRKDFFHSSGYANAQSGENFGAASAESYDKRQEIDRNRQFVQKYKSSSIASATYNRGAAKTFEESQASNPMGYDSSNASSLRESYRERFSEGEKRARFTTQRGAGGLGPSSTGSLRSGPVLKDAKAPIVPSRRSGI